MFITEEEEEQVEEKAKVLHQPRWPSQCQGRKRGRLGVHGGRGLLLLNECGTPTIGSLSDAPPDPGPEHNQSPFLQ